MIVVDKYTSPSGGVCLDSLRIRNFFRTNKYLWETSKQETMLLLLEKYQFWLLNNTNMLMKQNDISIYE